MTVTITDVKRDNEQLRLIKDKTELKPDHPLHVGHIKYNNIEKLYETLNPHFNLEDPRSNFHTAFGNLVMLTKLTLQVGIMELRLGQTCKDRANRAFEFIRTADNLNRDTYIFHALQLFIDLEISSEPLEIRQAVLDNIDKSNLWFTHKIGANPRASDEMRESAVKAVSPSRQQELNTFAQQYGLGVPRFFHGLFRQYLDAPEARQFILEQIRTQLGIAGSAVTLSATTAAPLPVESEQMRKARQLWEEIKNDGQRVSAQWAISGWLDTIRAAFITPTDPRNVQTLYLSQFISIEPEPWDIDTIFSKLVSLAENARHTNMPTLATWADGWLERINVGSSVQFPTKMQLIQNTLATVIIKTSSPVQQHALQEFQHLLQFYVMQQKSMIRMVLSQANHEEILKHLVQNFYANHLKLFDILEEHPAQADIDESLEILYQWLARFKRSAHGNITQRDNLNAYLFSHIHLKFSQFMQWLYKQLLITSSINELHINNLHQTIASVKMLNHLVITISSIEEIHLLLEDLIRTIGTSDIRYDREIKNELEATIGKLIFLDQDKLKETMRRYGI